MDRKAFIAPRECFSDLDLAVAKSQALLQQHQFTEGYWYYTLEANESIAAEYIFLTEFLGCPEPKINQAIARRILSQQKEDGSWSIYHGGPGELGATIECYWALKMCGYSPGHPAMIQARHFILAAGGPTKARVFTKIHMAMFGLFELRLPR